MYALLILMTQRLVETVMATKISTNTIIISGKYNKQLLGAFCDIRKIIKGEVRVISQAEGWGW